ILREVVVNLARDAITLVQNGSELPLHLSHAKAIELPDDEGQTENREGIEPVGLIEMGLQIKVERCARFVPDAVIVGGHDAKPVCARRKICVIGCAARPAVNPILIEAFELVLESDFLRRNKAQARVIEIESRMPGRDFNLLKGRDDLV